MLPAAQRLRRGADFAHVLRSRGAKRIGGRLIVVHVAPPDDRVPMTTPGSAAPALDATDAPPQAARVGFVVSKAVGNAVTRNRTKRRLRAIATAHLDLLQAGRDVVVRANPAAAAADYPALETAYVRQLTKALA